jgi:hypothetical protein
MPERRTYAERAEYLKLAVAKRRKKVRQMLVEYKGGKCDLCGYNEYIDALDLHHKNSDTKEFGISSSGLIRSWEKNKAESDKCVLLCVNCHREIHAGYKQPTWVTK